MAFNHKRTTGIIWCLAAFIALLHGARQYVTSGHGHVPTVPPSLRSNDVRQLVTQQSKGSSNENIRSVSHSTGIAAFLVGVAFAACIGSVIPAASAFEVGGMTSTTVPTLESSKATTSKPFRMLWDKGLVEEVTDQITGENLKPWERSLVQRVTDPITGASRKTWETSPVEQAMRPVKDYLRDEESKDRVPWVTVGLIKMVPRAPEIVVQSGDPLKDLNLPVIIGVGGAVVGAAVVSFSETNKRMNAQATKSDKD